jgi:hypothetical protein
MILLLCNPGIALVNKPLARRRKKEMNKKEKKGKG